MGKWKIDPQRYNTEEKRGLSMNMAQTPGFKKIIVPVIIAVVTASAASIVITWRHLYTGAVNDVSRFLESVKKTERGYIDQLPLYDDYATPLLEMKLRTYLFPSHMNIALKTGNISIGSDDDIPGLIKNGRLVRLDSGKDALYFFYNVRDKYRALTPDTVRGLDALVRRFQTNIAARAALPQVKIALSSLLRPASYQNDLRGINYNATPTTTHSYGVSFDVFYDDYYIVLPEPLSSNSISRGILSQLRGRMGFMLGDSLRGQLHSVLTETLAQLQDEGVLYAILEKRQRCYHVTILPGNMSGGKK
jgi:hypothetical protein